VNEGIRVSMPNVPTRQQKHLCREPTAYGKIINLKFKMGGGEGKIVIPMSEALLAQTKMLSVGL
jgi:hypothetical protein